MKGLNKVTLIGNLGKDPENTVLDNKTSVTKFSLATSESYKDEKGEKHTTTEWHSVVMWNSLASLAIKYLKKGSSIYLEGKLKTRIYETKEGEKKQITEIVAENFIMLDKPE
nr:single-stranded DNA-binding protein [Pseudopedobacter sp.]